MTNEPIVKINNSNSGSERASKIESFKVMDILQRANEIQNNEGRKVLHCEVGQPGTGAPKKVVEEAIKALSTKCSINGEQQQNDQREVLGYTDAFGLLSLREKIVQHYRNKYNNNDNNDTITLNERLNVENVIITTGSSGGFLLTFNGCFDVGDIIAVASSGYPCYRNIPQALGIDIASINVNEEFKLTSKELLQEIERRNKSNEKKIKGLILSSPSNPTGAMLTPTELKELCMLCDKYSIQFISDEIYHGISYGKEEATALSYSKNTIVINSFSKYYSMSGWRLGWMIIPTNLVNVMNKLQQNMFISAPTISQRAALKCWDDETINELNDIVQCQYKVCRNYILNKLECMKDTIPTKNIAPADGGFYIYIDLGNDNVILSSNSSKSDDDNDDDQEKKRLDAVTFCTLFLEKEGVAFTPGIDFEDPNTMLGYRRLRISYAAGYDVVCEAMERFYKFWYNVWLPMIQNDRNNN